MIETSDPMVAVVYGASCHESIANGLAAAFDLVAGGAGPWPLSDDARAQWAADLVARIHGGSIEDLPASLGQARRLLADLSTDFGAHMPGYLVDQVHKLDDRLESFLRSYPDGAAIRAVLVDAPSTLREQTPAMGDELPTLEEAVGFRRDQWMALMQARRVSVPTALAALKQDAEAAGKAIPERGLADVVGNEAYCGLLLHIIEEAS